ncbi:ADP-ribosylation factor-like protein 3 [Haliotis rubra]|uniref:ADP-ribosylation factor-like protein 3 n=1 Tax=Haliotis rubra TaxID=36100 RepID=UPI001EE5E5B2|nr:ADP-ribosylation factor-like protein 3 [Haliotis rubra]XP_046565617.1 ADP-ribosylation factor-like protein 3 [Haliotis rubra]XP_046565618.1 ADP-ribosylation factor-like protein 3 [Haliotis rubra]XP_046565620.1 ADP-ribosylation factor-like protein 3 [Haliotis rubra]XP_046565621.1 ADP-ribosylation factor-like protein 3 [Haliotis rubra]XP_046565622.1 ADP-ribosylation factor-like protein 3 [Haliotis rubra]XP_046565623.1 ADP-ribosylation factor-like protein 3 [Haliotis rubra]XP_046565624.1 ADP
MEVGGELKSALTSKPAVYVIGGTATIAAAYGLYKLWLYMREEDEYFENLHSSKDQSERRVLIIGLDGAGKTRFARCFCKGRRRLSTTEETTIGFYVNSVMLGSIYLNMWDVGGSDMCRTYWKEFLLDLDAICYVVDSSDAARLDESRRELHAFLIQKGTENIPLIIVATKQDKPLAMKPDLVYSYMQLDNFAKTRPIHLVSVQAPDHGQRKGFMETYRIFESLQKRRRHKSA